MTIADDIREERRRLCATFDAAGPDARTLIGAWSAKELASHLAGQDRLAGFPAFLARSAVTLIGLRFTAVYRDRERATTLLNGPTRPWQKSLATLTNPAPRYLYRPRVAPIALWEYVVHHEDVRRPNGLPRHGLPDLQPVLTWLLTYSTPRLRAPIRTETEGGRTRVEVGDTIALEGVTLDVVLWLSGRDGADLDVDGTAHELDRLRAQLRI